MRIKIRKEDYLIIILSILLVVSYANIDRVKSVQKDKWYNEKLEAAKLMKTSLEVIKAERIQRGLEIDGRYDILESGLIGDEISNITTTLGSLESKRTSINPNIAAIIIDMLKETNVEEEDSVAVNFSSSFPAINIAILSALQVLDAQPIIISSIGSSTWGANLPELTYPDMEQILYEKKILRNKSIAISIGGADDIGKDMDQETVKGILKRMQILDYALLYESDFSKNVQKRYAIYNNGASNIKLFINVGGNLVSMGKYSDLFNIKPGLTIEKAVKLDENFGLIQLYLDENTHPTCVKY